MNQGLFLGDALHSTFDQGIPVEAYVANGCSTDKTPTIIQCWASRLSRWRDHPDQGQANAINECMTQGTTPYIAWLNNDDLYLPCGVNVLIDTLEQHLEFPVASGETWDVGTELKGTTGVWVEAFSEQRLATPCMDLQHAPLIRRIAVGGLRETLRMAQNQDLWWRLFRRFGPLAYIEYDISANHRTKATTQRTRPHLDSMAVVRKHHGSVPLKWWLSWPISVWARSWINPQKS